MQSTLDRLFNKIIDLLSSRSFNYLIIGGMAVGVLGEPRMTHDIDLILFISVEGIPGFLREAKKSGFKFNRKIALNDVSSKGVFKLLFDKSWVDIIVASTEFENSALKRKRRFKLLGKNAYFPSPEDLILLKIIPGREKDLLDAKTVAERYRGKLDRRYLEFWAQQLSDEAQDLRIWNELNKIVSWKNEW